MVKTVGDGRDVGLAGGAKQRGDEAGLPVVAVDQVGRRIESKGECHDRVGEEREPRRVVRIVTAGVAVEPVATEVLVRDDERDGDVPMHVGCAVPLRADPSP